MAKYRKKPVVVDAIQWTGHNFEECKKFCPTIRKTGNHPTTGDVIITTIHGQETRVADGDWIIQEPDGIHHYPCKPDIFEQTYELVEEQSNG